MKTRASTEILRYWQSLRRSGRVPSRSQIDPAAIRSILADVFILEADQAAGGPALRFRLAGTRICSLFVRELRGTRFDSLWSSGDLERIQALALQVLAVGTPVRLAASAVTASGDRVTLELMLLPLRSSEGRIDRIFGSLAPTTRPAWLDAHALTFLTLDGVSHPDADAAVPEPEPRRSVGRSFVAAPQSNPLQPNPLREVLARVMHLSVLDGGKHG